MVLSLLHKNESETRKTASFLQGHTQPQLQPKSQLYAGHSLWCGSKWKWKTGASITMTLDRFSATEGCPKCTRKNGWNLLEFRPTSAFPHYSCTPHHRETKYWADSRTLPCGTGKSNTTAHVIINRVSKHWPSNTSNHHHACQCEEEQGTRSNWDAIRWLRNKSNIRHYKIMNGWKDGRDRKKGKSPSVWSSRTKIHKGHWAASGF